jgi:hypothetical protein
MANVYYPRKPPVSGSSDAGLMALGTTWNPGGVFKTEYIDFLQITALTINYDKGAVLSNAGAAGAKAASDKTSLGDSVYLYMPQNFATSYAAQYSNVAFGTTGKMAAEGLGKSGTAVVSEIQAMASDSAPEALFNAIAKGSAGLANTMGTDSNVTGAALSAVTQGKIFNPFEEMIFTGTGFRSHPFSWKLVARNKQDAEDIKTIIRFFKMNMLPNFSGSGITPKDAVSTAPKTSTDPKTNAAVAGETPFGTGSGARYLTVPNRFRLSVKRVTYPEGGTSYTSGTDIKNMFLMKDSILESFNVSYTPDGQYSSTTDGYVPAVQIDCTFKEVAYITAADAEAGY